MAELIQRLRNAVNIDIMFKTSIINGARLKLTHVTNGNGNIQKYLPVLISPVSIIC